MYSNTYSINIQNYNIVKEFILLEDINNELHVRSSCVTLNAEQAHNVFTARGCVNGDYVVAEVVIEAIDETVIHNLYDYMSL